MDKSRNIYFIWTKNTQHPWYVSFMLVAQVICYQIDCNILQIYLVQLKTTWYN